MGDPPESGWREELKRFIEKTFKGVSLWVDDIIQALYIFYKNKHKPPTNYIPPEHIREVKTTDDVSQAVRDAIEKGKKIRVLGAEHSAPGAILANPGDDEYLMLLLTDELREFEIIDKQEGIFRAGAGLHIGYNPQDRASCEKDVSHPDNSFSYKVDKEGYALSIVGGITQQTIGGFLSTGSAGGSLQYTFADNIIAMEYVDGKGICKTLTKPQEGKIADPVNDNEWRAFGVSMGLLGVITRVTFKLEPTYKVRGYEVYEAYEESSLKKDGQFIVQNTIEKEAYFRAYWFPQEGVSKVNTWKGNRVDISEKTIEFRNDLKNIYMQLAAGASLLHIDDMLRKEDTDFHRVARIMNLQTPIGPNKKYLDKWYKTIPSDDEAPVDSLTKIVFTEMWFPLKKTTEVMRVLEDLFGNDKKACWNTPIEIYSAKQSPFWLSPSNKGDMVRVDVFWYFYNAGGSETRDAHFRKFWEALINIEGIAFHWGKHVPTVCLHLQREAFSAEMCCMKVFSYEPGCCLFFNLIIWVLPSTPYLAMCLNVFFHFIINVFFIIAYMTIV